MIIQHQEIIKKKFGNNLVMRQKKSGMIDIVNWKIILKSNLNYMLDIDKSLMMDNKKLNNCKLNLKREETTL